jgi:(S)-mandelate dehydrogenase
MVRRLASAASIGDLAAMARRRIPSFAWHYLDGGVGEDRGVRRNEDALERILFRVRHLAGGACDPAVELFGQRYAQPFGVAPVGMANLTWAGTDLALARLAQREKIPYVLSTAGTTSIEEIGKAAPDTGWFQLYLSKDNAITADMMRRAWDDGMRVLALTIDVPVGSRRNRNIRGGVALPFRFSRQVLLELATHPAWALATARSGAPKVENYVPYAHNANFAVVGKYMADLNKWGFDWDDLQRVRDGWKGHLVVKGVLDPADAASMVRLGADGIWVSNHGGRQLESSPAPIDVLADIRDAVGPAAKVLFDSGVRCGEDIVKACALGADMVFCGRGFVYGTGAGGAAGGEKAFTILADQTRRALIQIGCPSIAAASRAFLDERSLPAPLPTAARREAPPRAVGAE